ncbi:MAG: metallophosphoesterase family protein [Clostridia bacterium]|nr:metallophosphoesterase family protein [Clostridia bacterium]
MKIAVLSDIHGNIVALEEAIKDAKEQGADKYIVLGDFITDLPFTDEVIDQVKDLTPYVIKGNREEYLLTYERTKKDEKWNTMQNKSVVCYYEHMREDNRDYIRNLPPNLALEFEGVKIKAVHASPDSITELIYFDTPRMEEIFSNLQEDILIYGHNHKVANHQMKNGKIVAQVGVLGIHNNGIGKAQYTILTCKNGQVSLEHRTLEYDTKMLEERIKRVGGLYPEARIWQNLNLLTIVRGKDIRREFCKEANQKMRLKYEGEYPNQFDSHFESFDDEIYKEVAQEFEPYFLL